MLAASIFDRYVVVRVNALKDFVDAIGGIDVPVYRDDELRRHLGSPAHPLQARHVPHMNGEQVQGYSRFRHDECSDPCRTKRQQQVMRILAEKP